MLESSQAHLAEPEGQRGRLIQAYSKGVLNLDEFASQKTSLNKQITNLGRAIAALRVEAEPQLLSAEKVEAIGPSRPIRTPTVSRASGQDTSTTPSRSSTRSN